jgi:hypothetical protein
MAFVGGQPAMPPVVILPPHMQPAGRIGQMIGQESI